jgi:hypothetical protein
MGVMVHIDNREGTTVKKYALLIYGDERQWTEASEADRTAMYAEYEKFGKMLEERNAVRGGAELATTSTATTVRSTAGDTLVTDGPFAETTEQLGGFYLVEAADLDEAIEFAKALPAGIVEVRPLVTDDDRR